MAHLVPHVVPHPARHQAARPANCRAAENHSTRRRTSDRITPMFRYAFLAAPSAVADAPKAAALLTAAPLAAAAAAQAPLGGARS
ncbi:hypothetical protein ACIQ7D_24885 [Streptomyces sp. NPDC096310]|uniref:hypothetical protein n=1 Tax=Streptomyces sp. NPDC096310 TaxID=3366082 RepID=UPI0038207953